MRRLDAIYDLTTADQKEKEQKKCIVMVGDHLHEKVYF